MSNGTDNFPKMPPYPAKPKAAAEHAVSPAESVQSIDTPEFRELVRDAQALYIGDDRSAKGKLIAHIDAKIAATHAEGRRSAMEELAKEKERADRAEAKIKADDETARLMFDDLRKARDEQARRAHAAEKRLLSNIDEAVNRFLGWKLPNTFSPDNGIAFYPPENPEFWAIGTNLFTADQAKAMFEYCLLAQPLQQEGRKDERAAFEEWHAERWGRPIRLGQTDQYKMDSSQGKWLAWQARAALLQPSDNLQQANTAQAELAKPEAACMNCNGRLGKDCAIHNPKVKEAASATETAVERDLRRAIRAIELAAEYTPELRPTESGAHSPENAIELLAQLLADAREAAQAPPEGADLPQIDYVSERVAFEAAQKYTGLDLTREGHDEYVSYHTHCAWGGWQDRAKLAATTAAESVDFDERVAFEDFAKDRFMATEYSFARAHGHGYYNTISSDTFDGRRQPAYADVQMLWDAWEARAAIARRRAAPPQQVE